MICMDSEGTTTATSHKGASFPPPRPVNPTRVSPISRAVSIARSTFGELPLPLKAEDPTWLSAIDQGMASIKSYAPETLLVSLGFDPFKGDPSADLAVSTEGFRGAGERIGTYRGPVVLIQEGGYLVEKLGENLAAFLEGFMRTRNTN